MRCPVCWVARAIRHLRGAGQPRWLWWLNKARIGHPVVWGRLAWFGRRAG